MAGKIISKAEPQFFNEVLSIFVSLPYKTPIVPNKIADLVEKINSATEETVKVTAEARLFCKTLSHVA